MITFVLCFPRACGTATQYPPWKQVILSSILREIFSRQQARAKEPTLPGQLRTPKRTEDPCIGGLRFGMKYMPDETFAVYPTGVQEELPEGTTVLFVDATSKSGAPVEPRRLEAPTPPKWMVSHPSHYGRTKTGDDILEANQQAFRGAKKTAITEAMWLDQLGVDFTRWEFALTPNGEHIARASIYLTDANTVSELMYKACQKHLPGAGGEYIRYRKPNGVVDTATLHVEIPDTGQVLNITGNRRDKAFLEWSIQLANRDRGVHPKTPLFTSKKVCDLFKYINDRIPGRKYWGTLEEEEEEE